VRRQSGERLSHEEVVDQLDEQTVFYEVGLGASGIFAETLRVTIRVEVAKYELAVAWLRDLLYGSEFTKERFVLFFCNLRAVVIRVKRLQITVAQILQALPGMKRDGSTVLSAVTMELLHDENSTTRAGGVLIQSEFIRGLSEKIHESPEEVIEAFESIRRNSEYLEYNFGRFSLFINIASH
jgi:Zn-dependent M16 (insulinase) family peptidase